MAHNPFLLRERGERTAAALSHGDHCRHQTGGELCLCCNGTRDLVWLLFRHAHLASLSQEHSSHYLSLCTSSSHTSLFVHGHLLNCLHISSPSLSRTTILARPVFVPQRRGVSRWYGEVSTSRHADKALLEKRAARRGQSGPYAAGKASSHASPPRPLTWLRACPPNALPHAIRHAVPYLFMHTPPPSLTPALTLYFPLFSLCLFDCRLG